MAIQFLDFVTSRPNRILNLIFFPLPSLLMLIIEINDNSIILKIKMVDFKKKQETNPSLQGWF
ncbi:hypothetical protein GFO_1674 [Christiangramia forsetii KT0803]|uniref:Uncharacterized protein n=1 Tax=Christiangramia forsetii (strain DSM 17595 / CGMCC 1.15422 / KT0803) TaxID=411154 RepID=A0M200_CHRFK|nr:hypothetical protein GFO_1674 [Christiangramia forsetii KT0803]